MDYGYNDARCCAEAQSRPDRQAGAAESNEPDEETEHQTQSINSDDDYNGHAENSPST